ncbi:MAG TPA: hypothetical protein DCM28_18720 [Phycisphaerales bacterium]|nr:hypothetical protein [Phycisphaerales bacterium]HCD34970.1 hypothetical protein [Phycisphaerales bacterium]
MPKRLLTFALCMFIASLCNQPTPLHAQQNSPLVTIDFESDKLDIPASELGWTKRYGNGNPTQWKTSKPAHKGNTSNTVLNIGGADVQSLLPLALTQPISPDTRLITISCQLHGSVLSGNAQPLRLAIASTDLKGITPFFGMTTDRSSDGGKMDLLRFYVGDNTSSDTVIPNHWYELQLVIKVDPDHPTACRATLFYRNLSDNDADFKIATGMKNVEFVMRKNAMPNHWGHWQLRGSYGGQVDNLQISIGTGAVNMQQASVPWTPSELPGGPVFSPITHQKDWISERDIYGYKPAFIPNPVSFDQNNIPYMRQGYHFQSGKKQIRRHPVAIQTLATNGQWEKIFFTAGVLDKYSWWDGNMHTGSFANERITFDKDNSLYTIIDAQRSNIGKVYLCYRDKSDSTWQYYPLPMGWTALETYDGHNAIEQPPAILSMTDKVLRLILPSKTDDGKLKLSAPVLIATDSLLVPNHSGGANSCLTVNGKTYVAWASDTPIEGQEGTPQYIAVYDHATEKLSKPVLLGVCGHGKPDNHNLPGITIDSKGILHIVLGAHHNQFKYTHSLKPYDITSWSEVKPFGKPKNMTKWGSYTYVSLLCDADDTLHVVGRWAGAGYYFRLVYMRKLAGQDWEPHKYLMVPFRNMYSCWYHKMSLDRQGRLFLSYIYYANQLSDAQLESYKAKWPDETPTDVTQHAGNWRWGLTPHDPGMLVSDDKGDSWHLATTADFQVENK